MFIIQSIERKNCERNISSRNTRVNRSSPAYQPDVQPRTRDVV